jgi:hypothetical protein
MSATRIRHDRHEEKGCGPRARRLAETGAIMSTLVRSFAAMVLALSLAACAPPPPPQADLPPPPHKKLDAKTQLETGHTY